ncbi:hypothetical protein [Clostridium oceanicum]|uniref:DUF5105 domain-containing protein n=1 Tax=Clostridium oceanicum TaxID=1543 RepID=A0ABN1JLZ2_9CLOT
MKKIKILVPFLLVLIFTMGLYGCGAKTPTDTVKNYLDEVKKGENGDFSNLVNKTLDKNKKDKDKKAEDPTTKKIGEAIKKLTYTINSENVDGDTAKVNVKVKGPDIATVLGESMKKGINMAFSEAFSGKKPTEAEQKKMYEKIFIESMDKVKYTDRTGDISLTKVEGKWKIKESDSLTKLLMNLDPSLFNDNSKQNKN